MNIKRIIIPTLLVLLMLAGCADDDVFTTSGASQLSFSADSVKLDTVFANVPTATRSFWVYNKTDKGIRCKSVRLQNGNQTGFRVNVDGTYLGQATGYQASDVEIRKGDSIRVFVELTSPTNRQEAPQLLEDNLLFTTEGGNVQKVNINAYTWGAIQVKGLKVSKDTTISGSKPIIIYGGIEVDSAATLTLDAGLTLYFHNDAGINVHGRLLATGTADKNVTLRGDRIDRMFDYLPYDYVTGQWQGVHFYASSYNNRLDYTDIHSTFNGVMADSASVEKPTLEMNACTVHNCQGYGIMLENVKASLVNVQCTNTLNDCLFVSGGDVSLNHCTLAQFYPFDSNRGVALHFSSVKYPLHSLACTNSLVTGYADDEKLGEPNKLGHAFDYVFNRCIMRTPKVETKDSVFFKDVIYENVKDTTSMGDRHFAKIDTRNLRYDFRLDSLSAAIDKADAASSVPLDRNGVARDAKPDIGAYEFIKKR